MLACVCLVTERYNLSFRLSIFMLCLNVTSLFLLAGMPHGIPVPDTCRRGGRDRIGSAIEERLLVFVGMGIRPTVWLSLPAIEAIVPSGNRFGDGGEQFRP